MAGTDSRAAQVSAEIPRGEVRHYSVTKPPEKVGFVTQWTAQVILIKRVGRVRRAAGRALRPWPPGLKSRPPVAIPHARKGRRLLSRPGRFFFEIWAQENMRITLNIVACLLVLSGATWFLQGINVLPGSFMTGQTRWAVYGGIAVAAGIALLLRANRPPDSLK